MRLRASLAALAATLLCLPASAQISLTRSNLFPFVPGQLASFDTFAKDATDDPADQTRIGALIELRGADQTWDFTTITYTDQISPTVTYFTDLTSLPGASNFPTANVATGETFNGPPSGPGSVGYTYGRLSDGSFVAVGSYLEADPTTGNVESIQTFDAAGLIEYTFPFTVGTTVSDETVVTEVAGPDTETYTLRESRSVLGYGTLVTPAGSAACLMVRQVITVVIDGVPETPITQYEWRTASQSVAATATGDDFIPGLSNYTALYSVLRSGGTASEASPSVSATLALTAAPNPARGASSVRLTAFAPAEHAAVTVTDALGREVARLHDGPLTAGDHAFPLDASGLAPGVYVVRVQAGREAVSTRLSVVR